MSGVRRWPLLLIAAPAAVAIWSGWVGLGQLCGFGLVHPLPGIWSGLQLDTAITLPVGVEAYGAYALGAWLSLGADHPARKFARGSAIGSLLLGMLGQVAYHLILHAGLRTAPALVVVLVSCLPVVTLGFGAALTHLLRAVPADPTARLADHAAAIAASVAGLAAALATPLAVPQPVPVAAPAGPDPLAEAFAADVQSGRVPGIRAIRSRLHVGQERAQQVQAYLRTLTVAQ